VPFLEYLSNIDFTGAVLVGVAVVAVAFVVNLFLQVSVDDLLRNLLPGAGRLIGQSALEVAHDTQSDAWFCRTCKSLNLAGAQVCYRGCGPRPEPPIGPSGDQRTTAEASQSGNASAPRDASSDASPAASSGGSQL
jgi:hypothetical protein